LERFIMHDPLQRLIDREEIRDLILRYARGVDRWDWDAVRALYHDDAIDEHGEYNGDVDGFITWVRTFTGRAAQNMHFLGNCLIEFADAEVAIVETYFVSAFTREPAATSAAGTDTGRQPMHGSVFGRYVDRVERRGGPWRIAHRVVVSEMSRIHAGDISPLQQEWTPPVRDPNDPIIRFRAEAGISA
jgi:3-phenylpropionate/cinnamic acid dioxygenase small subunit